MARNIFDLANFDLIGVALRRWPVLLAGLFAGIGLALAYLAVASTKYESDAQILVMKKDSNLPARGAERSNENAAQVSEDLLATHMQIVQSPQIVKAALQQNQLEGLPSIVSRLGAEEKEIDYIIDRLKVTRGGTGQARLANVLNVTFRHTSDEDCERVLKAVVESYQSFLADKFQDVSKEAVKLIAEAKNEIGENLENAEKQYQQFREAAPLLWNGDASTNTHRLSYERLQATMADLRVLQAGTLTRLEIVEEGLGGADGEADDMDLLSLIDEKDISRLSLLVTVKQGSAQTEEFQTLAPGLTANTQAQYQGALVLALKEKSLLQEVGPKHPSVQEVREQLRLTNAFIEHQSQELGLDGKRLKLDPPSLLKGYAKLLQKDSDAIKRRQAQLEALANEEEQAAKNLVASELSGETLRKAVERKQQLYDMVIDRLREINLIKDYGGLVTEVIAPVELGIKVWPKNWLVLLAGVFLGLSLGTGGAWALERLDRTFHTEDEVRDKVQLPVLTRLPKLKPATEAAVGADESGACHPTLVAFYRPKSSEAESLRRLRTSLFFNGRGRRQQILMLTSANSGDGKTLLSANLAVSIAQSGRKVLIIDADMRRPQVHAMFLVKTDTGLSSVIAGETDPMEAVQETAVPNLSVVACGPIPANPAELLTSARFEEALACYREHYDFILIDCPPVLAVADPCIIAPLADTVMLAVRLVKDMQSQVLAAKQRLEEVDANLIGLVVNGADAMSGMYGYGYGYGYRYGYGYGYNSSNGKSENPYFDDSDKPIENGHPANHSPSSNGV